MKKIIATILSAAMITAAIPAIAANDEIKIFVDGVQLHCDVKPRIINDYTMVPMRAIFERLGYTVDWYQESKTIDAINRTTDIEIILTVDAPYISYCKPSVIDVFTDGDAMWNYIDGNKQRLDISPIIIDGSTLVPVRAISEGSGCTVIWDGNNRSVNIFTEELVAIPIDSMDQITYYSGTHIPDIESITNVEFVDSRALDDGGRSYHYIYDSNAINDYVNYLLNSGYYLADNHDNGETVSYTYRKKSNGNIFVIISFYYFMNNIFAIIV